jgi:2-polyprenyl-3-methyl-5-hydroxy-6-metoxy-1,4-benzoquinol methylase
MPTEPINPLTSNYYATTAARGHNATEQHYRAGAEAFRRRIGPWMPANRSASLLDLGCGCGEVMYTFEKSGFQNVEGVDLCQEELDQARLFVRGQLHHMDVFENLRARADQSVDVITALNLVEHLPKASLPDFFKEVRRVLKSGGSFIAMIPNAISPFGASTRYWDLTHETAFTPNNFRQLAALVGLSPRVDFRECAPVPHGPVSTLRYVLWQGLRAGIASWFLIEGGVTRGGVYTMDMMVRLHRE